MDGHGTLAAQGLLPPDGFVEGLGGEHLAGVGHEQMQNCVFRGGQGDVFPIHGHGLGPVVQRDAADDDVSGAVRRVAAQACVPAQHGPDPGQNLHGDEGLGDVVVGAHVQAQDLVLSLGLGGEQDDGGVGKLPDFGGGGEAVHDGHHDVQQNQVDVVFLHHIQSLLAGEGLEEIVALGGEVDL